MSHLVFQNLLKISRGIYMSGLNRGFKLHLAGIIPGGGLGKLQGIKEEEYFTRQDKKLFENMKEKSEKFQCTDFRCFDYDHALDENPILKCTCSVKHKNLLEEAYFLNDHCDCLQILKAKAQKKDGKGDSEA